ncbi:hypothetical protein CEXT_628131 [Caerostris extrusa]|uniref:Uncharacterized protein n=1 Tax=Caerostris extrusa TaxID=172846 RepID=A0AAV4UQ75_CAEEX|nr:hypothetical protein CEXT_628131 [Caerostris extrusa]
MKGVGVGVEQRKEGLFLSMFRNRFLLIPSPDLFEASQIGGFAAPNSTQKRRVFVVGEMCAPHGAPYCDCYSELFGYHHNLEHIFQKMASKRFSFFSHLIVIVPPSLLQAFWKSFPVFIFIIKWKQKVIFVIPRWIVIQPPSISEFCTLPKNSLRHLNDFIYSTEVYLKEMHKHFI